MHILCFVNLRYHRYLFFLFYISIVRMQWSIFVFFIGQEGLYIIYTPEGTGDDDTLGSQFHNLLLYNNYVIYTKIQDIMSLTYEFHDFLKNLSWQRPLVLLLFINLPRC